MRTSSLDHRVQGCRILRNRAVHTEIEMRLAADRGVASDGLHAMLKGEKIGLAGVTARDQLACLQCCSSEKAALLFRKRVEVIHNNAKTHRVDLVARDRGDDSIQKTLMSRAVPVEEEPSLGQKFRRVKLLQRDAKCT